MLSEARTKRNQNLSEKITLVEQELAALTKIERERKAELNSAIREDLLEQRTKLAQLLATLLDDKRQREKLWKESLESEFSKHIQVTSDAEALEQYQTFLDKEPFEIQVKHYAIDFRAANILLDLYRKLDDEASFPEGHSLQHKLAYYLPCFIEVTGEKLLRLTAVDLMNSSILDYRLCQVLEGHFQHIRGQYPESPDKRNFRNSFPAPSCPPLEERNFWTESECVVCLSNKVCEATQHTCPLYKLLFYFRVEEI